MAGGVTKQSTVAVAVTNTTSRLVFGGIADTTGTIFVFETRDTTLLGIANAIFAIAVCHTSCA
jgi:hypothetical protein